MKFATIALFSVAFCTIRDLQSVQRRVPRTIGGYECFADNQTYLVSFRKAFSRRIFCVGTLISLRWALSAAHCFESMMISQLIGPPTATIGTRWSIDFGSEEHLYRQVRTVKTTFSYPDYDSQPMYMSDIAMVEMVKDFELNPYFVRVNLPTVEETQNCTLGRAMGWGRDEVVYDNSSPVSREMADPIPLKCVDLPITIVDVCGDYYQYTIEKAKVVCTLVEAGGKDVCGADAGSPLICTKGVERENVIVGVFSRNHGCGMPKTPTIFMKVDAYMDWIEDTIRGGTAAFHLNKFNYCVTLFVSIFVTRFCS